MIRTNHGHHTTAVVAPRIWREPTNHHDDCYFYMVDISKYKKPKDKLTLDYPSVPSSIAPVPHNDDLPVPIPPQSAEAAAYSSDVDSPDELGEDCDFEEPNTSPHFPNQHELDDLVRDLGLTKSNAELLTSRLKEWNLLDPSCKTSKYRKRHETFASFYVVADSLCYCHDVRGLFDGIGIDHKFNNRIFTIFQRLHRKEEYPGTGIGLSTCRKFVRLCGGDIQFESELGKGTHFTFTIPSNNKEAA